MRTMNIQRMSETLIERASIVANMCALNALADLEKRRWIAERVSVHRDRA
jgi:hypothetical protein